MVLDYSKWDTVEVSDDSDIEVHVNVDKRSFIRAKQNQIHQKRYERRQEIETRKFERIINDGLLERINALLDALRKHQDDVRNPDELVFQALIESAGDPAKDEPPPPPKGVYAQQKEAPPKFSQMIGNMIDQVKKDVDEKKEPNRYQAFLVGVTQHLKKVQALQQDLLARLASLEKEEASKITSDSIRTGFNTSHIEKSKENPKGPPAPARKSELLNPGTGSLDRQDGAVSSGAEADIEDGFPGQNEEDDDSDIKPTPLGKEFAKIKIGDHRACLQFISENPSILAQREADGLLVEAFNAQMDGKDKYARQCVHQGLVLQYCGKLGRDRTRLFFERVTTKDHQAGKVFMDDVNATYNRIKMRAAELQKEKQDPAGVEQIQLHAVDPSTKIHIVVPEADSQDPTEIAAREIFESFPPNLQKALQAASLDKVNDVLGKMSVEEAEEVVQKMGDGGMLSLEEGIVDATTKEGQQRLKEIEEENRAKAGNAAEEGGDELIQTGPEDAKGADKDGKPGDPE